MSREPEATSMSFDVLAAGWELWNREQRMVILTYRPDIFDSESFPAPCLPTIHIRKGTQSRHPGRDDPDPEDPWYVTLYLEPEIEGPRQQYDSKAEARDGALELAEQFATGEIDYRGIYQVPRPKYFEKLDELTGQTDE